MDRKQFSFQDSYNDLNGKLSGFAQKLGLSQWEAENLVQGVWYNIYEKLKEKPELHIQFESKPGYAYNYIFKAVKNTVINEGKKITKRKNYEQELKEESGAKFEDPVEMKQRSNAVQTFINELKNELKDDETQFLDLWLEYTEQNVSANISEIARLMGLKETKGHDIFRRIKRKAQAFEAKNNLLKDVAASAVIFDLGIFDFIKDIFRPRFTLDKKYQKSGERISNKVLTELGPDAISLFSKFVK